MYGAISQIIFPLILLPLLALALWRIRLKKLAVYHSPLLGKIEVLQKYNGEKILTTNSYVQGISIEKESAKKSYWFAVAKQATEFCRGKKDPRILMLGLGANTISNFIALINPQIRQIIVEIDENIIKACRKFFGLDTLPNYKLIQTDAFSFDWFDSAHHKSAQDGPKKRFDVIIVDIFLGAPPYVSINSNQPNFIEKLLPYLKKEGMIIFNRPGHNKQVKSDSQLLKKYLKTLFQKTQFFDIKDPRGFRNSVIIGAILKKQFS